MRELNRQFLPQIRAASVPRGLLQHMRYLRGDPTSSQGIDEAPSRSPVWTLRGWEGVVGREGRAWPSGGHTVELQPSLHQKRLLSPPGMDPQRLRQGPEIHPNQGPACEGQAKSLPQKRHLVSFWGTLSQQLVDLNLKKMGLDVKLGNVKQPISLLIFWVLLAEEKKI